MQLVRVSYRISDIADGKTGEFEQFCCFCHTVVQQELLRRTAHGFFKDTPEICAVQSAERRNLFYGYIILKVLFNIV